MYLNSSGKIKAAGNLFDPNSNTLVDRKSRRSDLSQIKPPSKGPNVGWFALSIVLSFGAMICEGQESSEGTRRVKYLNYENCVEIFNDSTSVVLCHQVGGRILTYSLAGKNALYVNPEEANWDPSDLEQTRRASAGRFDVGPEYLMPRSATIWSGKWSVKVTGPRQATMTSQVCPKFGIQVIRDFKLAPNGSDLIIKQTVLNKGKRTIRQNYWSRTFGLHGGTVIVPCDPDQSILPNLYYMSRTRYLIDFRPENDSVKRIGNYLLIKGPTKYPKLGFDACAGWVAYQSPNDLLFIKKYPVYKDRKYIDPGSINLSVWYPPKKQLAACEIEPIGPLEVLKPGDRSEFQVLWKLIAHEFPESGEVDPNMIAKQVE